MNRHWKGWAALGASVLIYIGVGLAMHQPFHEGARALNYFDLKVYRGAAERVRGGVSLYETPIRGVLGFTYPPFAALMMTPLTPFGIRGDELGVTAANLMLLVWLIRRTLALPEGGPVPARRTGWAAAAGLGAAALWIEPISVTLGYGQIDLLIATLVIGDLSRPDGAPGKGLGVGLAAALKLTPLLFIPYLLASGRRRAALLASGVFAASIGVSCVVLPGDAARYWGGRLFLDSARVGGAGDTANQSLRGALQRLIPGLHTGSALELALAGVALAGLALAVRAGRSGDEAAGVSLVALTALLVSPISWTHHWTLAVPALILLLRRAHRRGSWPLRASGLALLALGYLYVPEWMGSLDRHPRGPLTLLTSDPYVLVGVLGLLTPIAQLALMRRRETSRRHPRRVGLPARVGEPRLADARAPRRATAADTGAGRRQGAPLIRSRPIAPLRPKPARPTAVPATPSRPVPAFRRPARDGFRPS